MKKSLFTLFSLLFFILLNAQSDCFLKLGSETLPYAPEENIIYNKADIINAIFGNVYYNCNGAEEKIRSFNLFIQGEKKTDTFARFYPSNYILPNDTILNLLNNSKHCTLYLDSIRLYDGKIVAPLAFKF